MPRSGMKWVDDKSKASIEHPVEIAMLRNCSNSNSDRKTFYNAKVDFVKDKD